jgi:hypothetical protein
MKDELYSKNEMMTMQSLQKITSLYEWFNKNTDCAVETQYNYHGKSKVGHWGVESKTTCYNLFLFLLVADGDVGRKKSHDDEFKRKLEFWTRNWNSKSTYPELVM